MDNFIVVTVVGCKLKCKILQEMQASAAVKMFNESVCGGGE